MQNFLYFCAFLDTLKIFKFRILYLYTMIHLDKEIHITEELLYRILLHFKRYGTDYAKSVGRDLKLNKREACKLLRLLFENGYLEKRVGGMLKKKEAKLKRRVTTHTHHTYYVLSEKGLMVLKNLEKKYQNL